MAVEMARFRIKRVRELRVLRRGSRRERKALDWRKTSREELDGDQLLTTAHHEDTARDESTDRLGSDGDIERRDIDAVLRLRRKGERVVRTATLSTA